VRRWRMLRTVQQAPFLLMRRRVIEIMFLFELITYGRQASQSTI
jgi:hypothetical protein